MNDLIRRQDAIDLIKRQTTIESMLNPKNDYERGWNDATDHLIYAFKDTDALPSAQRWIPVKWKPLNDLEREEWEDAMGYKLTDEEVKFGEADFKLPNDGDDIWVCTKSGIVDGDIFYNDNGMITLEYADITDIVAWMPKTEPEPYKGET